MLITGFVLFGYVMNVCKVKCFWTKVPLQFHVSDYGLVTVAWDSSKICLLCTVGIEAVLYDCYESACMMPLLWWLQYIWCVFYDLTAVNTACINSMIKTVARNEASCVMSPVLLMCGSITSVVISYLHTFLQRFALWLIVVDEEYGNTVVG